MTKHAILLKNSKYDLYECKIASVVYKGFDKKTSNKNTGIGISSESKELAKELPKPIFKMFGKRPVDLYFKDNI